MNKTFNKGSLVEFTVGGVTKLGHVIKHMVEADKVILRTLDGDNFKSLDVSVYKVSQIKRSELIVTTGPELLHNCANALTILRILNEDLVQRGVASQDTIINDLEEVIKKTIKTLV